MLDRGSPDYPNRLRYIHRPPEPLYIQGPFTDWHRPSVAIVGTRAASAGGRGIAEEIAYELALRGIVILSGLARGIDRAAHEGALKAKGVTIAVIGTGLDVNYPREHYQLRRDIAAVGAIVSEFPYGTPPLAYHFPRRNRILAGMSDLILVVEAELRSGALITAQWGLEQGKEVMAIPRNPWDSGSEGVNRLIRDGARPVTDARDIVESLDALIREPMNDATSTIAPSNRLDGLSAVEAILGEIKKKGSADLERLYLSMPELSPSELSRHLSRLELDGRIRRGPQGFECADEVGSWETRS
ncbi:MAG: DNA-processing protein DprA [Candidatus Eisenbacteria bacterium]|uniref:DNA-processing protein DprA n=1 Tax=Eiseniibacteriota bacterium TaxID=2212470 RepID=A0A948RWS7_UNCEI|nr:DNA-processing protein DprA [Candidatus Eisenbacteria bacterium]MBU1947356.1 DNA-processing protein DprA [Candidatus Eisenbacteria bacterium]MBU2692463.1 DNA-processing protein DprA [Candidatus Eisenbacteria bacterium]